MIKIIGGVILALLGFVVLLIIVYIASGVQAKAWIDVIDKYFSEKLKK